MLMPETYFSCESVVTHLHPEKNEIETGFRFRNHSNMELNQNSIWKKPFICCYGLL